VKPGRVLFGLALIALGLVFLLDRAGVLDAGRTIADWWPVAVIALGAVQLFDRPRSLLGPGIVIGVGMILLLFTTDVITGSVFALLWPALLIAIGLAILFRHGRGPDTTVEGSTEAEQHLRARLGFATTARQRRQHDDAARREVDLVEGEHPGPGRVDVARAGDLLLGALVEARLHVRDEIVHGLNADRAFLARLQDRAAQFLPVEGLAPAVLLHHDQLQPRLDPLVGGEARGTKVALAPPPDGGCLVDIARVDDPRVTFSAVGTAHGRILPRATTASGLRRGYH
jgi:hypothetical protein